MRMWMIDPKLMCNQHLQGEHVETHMLVGVINKQKKLQGYIDKGLVEVHNLRGRHDALAFEMLQRGMKHISHLPEFKDENKVIGFVDRGANIVELCRRCSKCRERIKESNNG